ncbi:MAG: DegV family EDD domain-containing protein [Bacteroidales bacterium]|nr:DegV family EDD domain-containing protein [Bacteroidales bacterium]MCF8404308.1 DegV family EDD domain-containing protein [Bacteroidales bacterium]
MDFNRNELDGKRFYYSFIAGAQKIFEHYQVINKINVFPVADGDTGTNLASTMRSIIDTAIPTYNIKVTANALADAALVGARGNSGIIFAQFLYGFSNEIPNNNNLSINDFAEIIKKAVRYAYEAIANPVEGTMISVMREWAEYVYSIKDKFQDFNELIVDSYQTAADSLRDTPKKLEVLRKAHVVDAGAKGFVLFLEGMIDFFKHGELKKLAMTRNVSKVKEFEEVVHDHEVELSFRYCTEALISFENESPNNKSILSKVIAPYGDSVVVAGSPKKLRLHIHTDEPAKLFSEIKDLGNITFKKVDDMLMQSEIVHRRKYDTALITDSTCDLPQDIIEKYQIHVVPLTVHFDKDFYLDSVTITPDEFYHLQKLAKNNPTTSQPTYKDFTNKYSYLASHYKNIIGLHLTDKMSGTFSNSKKAGHAVAERHNIDIAVFSSNKLTNALGLMVLRAAEAIESGLSYEDLKIAIEDWKLKAHLMVSAQSLKYMIKSGRVSTVKGFLGKLMGVQPIVVVNAEGKAELFGKPTSTKQAMKLVIEEAAKLMDGKKIWGYSVSHANNPEGANWYVNEMEQITGLKPRFVNSVSPVLGTHVGPGVVGLGILLD